MNTLTKIDFVNFGEYCSTQSKIKILYYLTPGLQAKSTSVGCNFGANGQKSQNKLKIV